MDDFRPSSSANGSSTFSSFSLFLLFLPPSSFSIRSTNITTAPTEPFRTQTFSKITTSSSDSYIGPDPLKTSALAADSSLVPLPSSSRGRRSLVRLGRHRSSQTHLDTTSAPASS